MADQSSFLKPLLRDLVYGVDAWKKPVKVASATNITSLSGPQTLGGAACVSGDEVLLVGQTSGAQNGIWVVASGAWSRRVDADSAERLFAGVRVPVTQGTYASAVYRLTTTGTIRPDITAQTWEADLPIGGAVVTDVTATAPIAVATPSAGVRRVSITAADASNPGSMSAADKRFEDNLHAAAGAALTDADATIQIGAGAWRRLPTATLTAPRTLTIGTTGAVAGDQILVQRLDVTQHAYALVNGGPGAGTMVTLPGYTQSFAIVQFDGTNWEARSFGAFQSAAAFLQGGNSFGATAVLGSQDADVSLIAGGGEALHATAGDGFVGIHNGAPEAYLHVDTGSGADDLQSAFFSGTSSATGAANSVDAILYNKGASNTRVRFIMGGNVTAERWSLETDSGGDGTRSFALVDLNAAATRWYVDSNGRFGIGTANPQARFHVSTGAAATTEVGRLENTAGDIRLFVGSGSPEGAITGDPGDWYGDVTGALWFKVTGTGNTGWQRASTSAGMLLFGATSTSTTLVRYMSPGGAFAVGSAAPECMQVTEACKAITIRVDITTAGTGTGGGNTFTYTLCTVDTSDVVTATALTLTLDGDARFGSATASVSLPAGTRITVRVTPAGTVTSWTNAKVAVGLST